MAVHAKLSGSKAERWINCPASVSVCVAAPEEPSSPEALEGTQAHLVAEMMLRQWIPPKQDDMTDFARDYIDWIETYQFLHPGITLVEHSIQGSRIDPDTGCILDVVHASPETNTLFIIDYKYGAGIRVEPENNSQLLYGAMMFLDSMGKKASTYSYIGLCIYQPRGENPGGRIWWTDYATVQAFRARVETGVKAIRGGLGSFHAGDWCRWCLAKAHCRTHYEAYVAPVKAKLDTDIQALTEAECESLLRAKSKVTQFYKVLDARVRFAARFSGRYAGHCVLEKPGRTGWVDEPMAEQQLPLADYPYLYNFGLKTPLQINKSYPDLAERVYPLAKRGMTESLVAIDEEYTNEYDS